MAGMIAVNKLTKTFDPSQGTVLDAISFSMAAGASMSVIGPSGCGKTTLLYILAGLTQPSSGSVVLRQNTAHPMREKTAFILQDFGLFPWKTVAENIALGIKLRQTPAKECRRVTAALLDELDMASLGRRFPAQLSGGQKQRVAIARALATTPELLLMDEPFSSLDAITRERLQNTLLDLWQRRKLTYIIVTHSVEEAVFLGQTVLVLSQRPARVKAIIANPDFGQSGFRTNDRFFGRIKQVREVLET